jgi:hypothetical protein
MKHTRLTPASPSEVALNMIQREFPQYHPLIALSRLAHRLDVTNDPKLELEVHRTILPYIQPRLSNVEVKTNLDDARRIVVTLFDESDVEDAQITEGLLLPSEISYVTDASEVVPLD